MGKKEVKIAVPHMVSFDNGQFVDINFLIKTLEQMKSEKADSVCFYTDETEVEIQPMSTRLETDSEFKERLAADLRRDAIIKELRRMEYEKLKKEFEPTN